MMIVIKYLNKFFISLRDNGVKNTFVKLNKFIIRESLIIFKNYYYKFVREKHFTFDGVRLEYFYHLYNKTYENERIIEIPIISHLINKYNLIEYCELGNVVWNYGIRGHMVIDKYDLSSSVLKEDIATYKPSKKIANMISISTLEHVGWDEGERGYDKVGQAFNNIMNNVIIQGGYFIYTFPVGYNPFLDNYILKNKNLFKKLFFMKRISIDNVWVETNLEDCMNTKFDSPFINANGLVIGILAAK
ncbi:hypothetical protein CL55_00003220 [Polynucleobacter duraquae]|uniref:Methyltransferase type 11 domain-containing protein n=1 Tax=Polynucleobacter duraquae TaxID=1835254 RepID=A0A0E3ZIS1_9BURK|nr:hypothetical protein [Polynucleobacter duraquae]AKD24655.1 hypothetical protein CL55_00003220 [Polynucleobacter duraquae]